MKVRTVRDARLENLQAKEARQASIERRELRAKIRRWEGKVREFGGQVHVDTLARLRARLEALS